MHFVIFVILRFMYHFSTSILQGTDGQVKPGCSGSTQASYRVKGNLKAFMGCSARESIEPRSEWLAKHTKVAACMSNAALTKPNILGLWRGTTWFSCYMTNSKMERERIRCYRVLRNSTMPGCRYTVRIFPATYCSA